MKSEKIPTEIFVQQVFATRAVQQIIDDWPIKSEVILQAINTHLGDLGIYSVNPLGQGPIVRKEIIFFLKNSPALIELIAKAQRAAAAAAASSRNRIGRD
jgi:hypothetical protein